MERRVSSSVQGILVLGLVLVVGLLAQNQLISGAAAILLAINLVGVPAAQRWLEVQGIQAGIMLLTVAVLAPLASGKMELTDTLAFLRGSQGLSAIAAGALAAYLTGRGVDLLQSSPQVIMGLAVGSILGTAFLRGVPAGPLVAAGFAAVFLTLTSS